MSNEHSIAEMARQVNQLRARLAEVEAEAKEARAVATSAMRERDEWKLQAEVLADGISDLATAARKKR